MHRNPLGKEGQAPSCGALGMREGWEHPEERSHHETGAVTHIFRGTPGGYQCTGPNVTEEKKKNLSLLGFVVIDVCLFV